MNPTGDGAINLTQENIAEKATYRAAILVINTEVCEQVAEDLNGPAVSQMLSDAGMEVDSIVVVPGEYGIILRTLQNLCKPRESLDLIITTGGTGLSRHDVTPEATHAIADRMMPGIPEIIRAHSTRDSLGSTFFRGAAGIKGSTLIINLPGNPTAAVDALELIREDIIHGLSMMDERCE